MGGLLLKVGVLLGGKIHGEVQMDGCKESGHQADQGLIQILDLFHRQIGQCHRPIGEVEEEAGMDLEINRREEAPICSTTDVEQASAMIA